MNGLNRAFFVGRLGADPDLRHTATGVPRLQLGLATDNHRKEGDEWVPGTDWHQLIAWSRNAEYLAKYAKKGDALAVECVVRENKWTDREGKTRYSTIFVVERVLYLFSKQRVQRTACAVPNEPREPIPYPADLDMPEELPPPTDEDFLEPAGEDGPT